MTASARPGQGAGVPVLEPAQVTHTIPSRMRLGRAQTVEVRIQRTALSAGLNGASPHALRGESAVARAVSVRLRPGRGAFQIDAVSPETIWDQASGQGRTQSEAAVWRFTVTPTRSGSGALQLIVASKTIGADAVIADTILPEQTLTVRASTDFAAIMRRIAIYAAVALGGMLVAGVLQDAFKLNLLSVVRYILR